MPDTTVPPDREALGRVVRDEWIAWAREQPDPKPSWLLPWEDLDEADREVDRRIGERLYRLARDGERERIEEHLRLLYGGAIRGVQTRGVLTTSLDLARAASSEGEAHAYHVAMSIARGET